MKALINRLFNIQQKDWNKIIPLWIMSYFLFFGNIMGVNSTNSLFISRYSVDSLPGMYILTCFTVIFLSVIFSFKSINTDRIKLITRSYLFFCAVITGIYLTLLSPSISSHTWYYPGIYIITQAIWLLGNILFWGAANDICDTREAKRIFPILASGGLLGCISSGVFSGLAVKYLTTVNLYLVWAICQFMTLLIFKYFSSFFSVELQNSSSTYAGNNNSSFPSRSKPSNDFFKYIRANRFLWLLCLATILLWITVTVCDFLYFKITAQWASKIHPDSPELSADSLTALYGSVRAGASFLGLLIQLFITNRLFGALGIGLSLLLFPIFSTAMFALLSMSFTFIPGILARSTRIVMINSIQDPLSNLLYSPVSSRFRLRIKSLMDGVLLPIGMAIAGVLILVFNKFFSIAYLTKAIFLITLCWCFVAWLLKKEYLNLLINNLRDNNYNTRLMALEGLGRSRDKRAVLPLIEALDDENPQIRLSAASALGKTDSKIALDPLIRALKDPDIFVRSSAAQALGELGYESATPALLDLFETESHNRVKATIVSVLGRLGSQRVIPALLKNLKNSDSRVRANAIEALGTLAAEKTAKELSKYLSDPNNRVRANASVALYSTGEPGFVFLAVDTLTAMSCHHDKWMRASAASAYGMIQESHFAPHLLKLLGDKDINVRRNAAKSLAIIPGAENVDQPLFDSFKLENESIAKEITDAVAARGISMLPLLTQGSSNFATSLDGEKKHLSITARKFIAKSLGKIGGKEACRELTRLLKDSDPSVKVEACLALQNNWEDDLEEEFSKLLTDPDGSVRATAAKTFGLSKKPQLGLRLIPMISDSDPRVRANVLDSLIELKTESPDLVSSILPLLRDTEPRVKSTAAILVFKFDSDKGNTEALPVLKTMLTDPDKWVKIPAIYALGRIGSSGYTSLLLDLLTDQDPDIRRNTVNALQKIGGTAIESLSNALKTDKITGIVTDFPDRFINSQQQDLKYELKNNVQNDLQKALQNDILLDLSGKICAGKTDSMSIDMHNDPLSEEPLMPDLINALEDDQIRTKTAEIIGNLGNKEFDVLLRALEDHNGLVREKAVEAIANLDNPQSSQHLIKALDDINPGVQKKALDCLGLKKKNISAEVLRAYIDKNIILCEKNRKRIKKLSDPLVKKSTAMLVNELQKRIRLYVALILDALGILFDSPDTGIIGNQIFSSDSRAFSNALEALDNIIDKDISKRLLPLLENLRAQNESKDNRPLDNAFSLLLDIAESNDEIIQSTALETYAELGLELFVAPLKTLAQSNRPGVSSKAESILKRVGINAADNVPEAKTSDLDKNEPTEIS